MMQVHQLLPANREFDIGTSQFKDEAGRPVLPKVLLSSHPLKEVSLHIGPFLISTGDCVPYDDNWYRLSFFQNDVQLPLQAIQYHAVKLTKTDGCVWPRLAWGGDDVLDVKDTSDHLLQNMSGRWTVMRIMNGLACLPGGREWYDSADEASTEAHKFFQNSLDEKGKTKLSLKRVS